MLEKLIPDAYLPVTRGWATTAHWCRSGLRLTAPKCDGELRRSWRAGAVHVNSDPATGFVHGAASGLPAVPIEANCTAAAAETVAVSIAPGYDCPLTIDSLMVGVNFLNEEKGRRNIYCTCDLDFIYVGGCLI